MGAADDWDDEGPSRIWFSAIEILHLLLSVAVLTTAFALVLAPCPDPDGRGPEGRPELCPFQPDLAKVARLMPYAAIAVVPAFILHELAHKVVAQRKDMWAEFRANYLGSAFGILVALGLKALVTAPGVVQIHSHITRETAREALAEARETGDPEIVRAAQIDLAEITRAEGVISILGPLVNLAIGYLAFLLDALLPRVALPDAGGFGVSSLWELVAILNAVLSAFNMLPIGPLDGRKVWRWSPVGFFGMWALTVALALLALRPALPF